RPPRRQAARTIAGPDRESLPIRVVRDNSGALGARRRLHHNILPSTDMKRVIVAAAAAFISWPLAAAGTPEDFRARLSEFIGPDFPIGAISETPLANVYEVTAGNRVLYVAMKDELILVGSMYDTQRNVNLGEEKQNEITRRIAEEEIGKLSVDDMVVFKGDESKRHITVFTDVECGYCRRLHQEVPQLNEAGIEVRYLAFPVISQKSYPNAVSVWCADDQQTAMT